MSAFLGDFITILQTFFPRNVDTREALLSIALAVSLRPLIQLHNTQQREPRQPHRTAWYKSILELFRSNFDEDSFVGQEEHHGIPPGDVLAYNLTENLETIYDFLGLDIESRQETTPFFPAAPKILITSRTVCAFCPQTEIHSLRRQDMPQQVRYLDESYTWQEALVFVGRCPRCHSEYYPDRYTYILDDQRTQTLEYDSVYLRVSKKGVWMHRNIAEAQEHAVFRFRCGWSNFAGWLNDILQSNTKVSNRQAQRLFIEHFAHRLLKAHGKANDFQLKANTTAHGLASAICDAIGHNGGTVPSSFHHGCQECTHRKRFRSDLIAEGALFNEDLAVAGLDESVGENIGQQEVAGGILQDEPVPGQQRGYVRMAVMDGKTIGHRICALNTCQKPLSNFKNGRFCVDHLNLRQICGIIPCGRPTATESSVTCDNNSHREWHEKYVKRFSRLSYPGVRRVIRRQQNPPAGANPFTLNIEQQLPALGDVPGNEVSHTFRARSVYCVETVQWACGIPIGWGKCYNSESAPQVLSIITRIWEGQEHLRPSFFAYDDACDLLRHIATQNNPGGWLNSTKFIVDAWHYIGHRATDILCRLWCNPAPTNGSQPDLIIVQKDAQGHAHSTRAFNTETAEHFNSWLAGFEAQLSQMSDVNFDFFMHSLFLLFKDDMEKKIQKKGQELPDTFWDEVGGNIENA